MKKIEMDKPLYKCHFCEKELPLEKVENKVGRRIYECWELVRPEIENVRGFLFHKKCTEHPCFLGWVNKFIEHVKH